MIPNILWQSWKTRDIPESIKTQSDSWNRSNPQLEKRFMNDAECSQFILEYFGESVHQLYLQLPQPIMRADFWRVAVVYIHGGYYADLDITCNVSIDDLISGKPCAVFTRELDNISNFFFGAEPQHPALKLALDYMIEESKSIVDKEVQSFGMHNLHRAVREYYNIKNTEYNKTDSDVVVFIDNEKEKREKRFIHGNASLLNNDEEYSSWRSRVALMNQEREESNSVLFFTTFNKNGYDLYGKEWIKSFISIANYYTKFRAKIYYEGFDPQESHPNIEWINFREVVNDHSRWKTEYLKKSQHPDYVRTMTVRFSHKAFVIQHVLDTQSHDYLVWLDGDCVFKNSDYTRFPNNILNDKFLACQVEHNHDLNHIESGILMFKGNHLDTKRFNEEFKKHYEVDNIIKMGQPYDGFVIYKALLTSGVEYTNLNQKYGKGGIQSDPTMTFCHPEIQSKFIHNIGWTGKNQYDNWEQIYHRDDVFQKMNNALFGNSKGAMLAKKKRAREKIQKLKRIRQ